MKLVFSHGEKGGVGKSMTACVAIELAIRASEDGTMVSVVDGDVSNGDVYDRYKSHGSVADMTKIALNDPTDFRERINDLVSFVEKNLDRGSAFVIINLPAGAAGAVDKDTETLEVIKTIAGVEIITLLSVGPSIQSVDHVKKICADGIGRLGRTKVLVQSFLKGHADEMIKSLDSVTTDGVAIFPSLDAHSIELYHQHHDLPLGAFCDVMHGKVGPRILRYRFAKFTSEAAATIADVMGIDQEVAKSFLFVK